jgi:hypothetical protein
MGDALKFFGIDKNIVSAAPTALLQLPPLSKTDDYLLEADDGSFVHFEFQTTDKPDDLPRFMISDAMLYYKTKKPIKTIVVYSADIKKTITSLNVGSIHYNVEAFYMSVMDGDRAYEDIKARIEAGEPLTKQDLMSIVFLPLMKNSVDKVTRITQSVELSKALDTEAEQEQIQAMLMLLAEKFIPDMEILRKIKELMTMGAIAEMIIEDARNDIIMDEKKVTARNALKKNLSIDTISFITGLDEAAIRDLQVQIESE